MDARIREELVEVVEPSDVADLGEEGRRDRRADAWDRQEPPGDLAVEEAGDAAIGSLDLGLQEIVLVEQQADLLEAVSASSSGTAIVSAAAPWSCSARVSPRRRRPWRFSLVAE